MENIFDNPIDEVIKSRHSVRNYEDKLIPKDLIKKIEHYIENIDNPFGKKVRIKLIKKDNSSNDLKLGTYGVIKGAKYYLAVACKNEDFALEALGYTFEKAVLYCTSLGLGTVWLGGTFNKGEFAKAMNVGSNEIMPIVSPLGYEGGKKSFLASLMGNNNKKRKSYGEVFFNNNFDTPLLKEDEKDYSEVLEMVRIAPSAMNKQPWRILKVGNDFDFYTEGNKDFSKIDIGIALCHFHLAAKEKGLDGEFKILDNISKDKYNYIISWIRK